MTDIVIAATQRQLDDAFAVRVAVFVEEQHIPREEELDDLDATAIHCVGYEASVPVATGRLVAAEGYGKIGRMAVIPSHRRRGLGRQVLDALEHAAAGRGLSFVKLSAQLSAAGFYDGAGYARIGDVYDEVGIPHIAMEKRLHP